MVYTPSLIFVPWSNRGNSSYEWLLLCVEKWWLGLSLSQVDPLNLKATTIALAAIIVTQIANGLTCRTTKESLFKVGVFTNRYLLIGIAIEIILIFLIVYSPPLQHIFSTAPLYLNDWLILLPFAALLLFADELRKWLARRSTS
jgi:magnesium-transporting ATPase (P-type)